MSRRQLVPIPIQAAEIAALSGLAGLLATFYFLLSEPLRSQLVF